MKDCSYGCGQEGKYFCSSSKKYRCSKNYQSCPSLKTSQSSRTFASSVKTSELCGYGCGQIARFRFRSGRLCCSERLQSCLVTRKRNSEMNKIKQSGKNNAMFGKKQTDESKRKNKESNIKNWKDPNFVQKVINGLNLKPNKPERFLIGFLDEYIPKKFKYVGDFKVWINGKNPDFINESERKIIEFFGEYFHEPEDEEKRKSHFESNGYRTLIIWEKELKNMKNLKEKILRFNNESKE